MQYLLTDEQTLDDLAIFGKPGKPSVFSLFHKTATQGGASRLEKMFRQPLANEAMINERAKLYRFFSEQQFAFPVDTETIGLVAYYLENEDERTQLSAGAQSLKQKLRDIVSSDANYLFAHTGVQASLRLFYQVETYIKSVAGRVLETAYAPHFAKLVSLLHAGSFDYLREYVSDKFETKLAYETISALDKKTRFENRNQLLEVLELLYELDVYIAVGQVARTQEFQFATALPAGSNAITYEQVYHPHVQNAVANDLSFNSAYNILFLTGANMAGKSTLMKSIGIALYLAHMGFPVAAKRFEFAVRDGLFTSINLADNLQAGASHYYAEVLRVKEVAQTLASGKRIFVIFDELFRGTNVKDAYDATIALTRAFSKKSGSQFVISTHIMEAGEVLQQEPLTVQYQYLPTEMKGSTPVYTRVLKEGITADRQGMIIIQNEGILEMLDAGIKEKEEAPCHS